MKTKSLLLTALLTVAGTAGLMAQSSNVYSQNIVGYVTQTIPSGFSMISVQLKGSVDNKVQTLFPAPPNNTSFYQYFPSVGRYKILTYVSSVDGWDGEDQQTLDMTLNPGQGSFIFAPSSFTNTSVGEVQLSSTNTVLKGFNMVSSALPVAGQVNTDLQYPVGPNDAVYRFNTALNRYDIWTFVDGDWDTGASNPAPVPNVGEGFWIFNAQATNTVWARTITVGP